MTFPAQNIRDWRGHTVRDEDGDKIGTLEAVYYDTAADEPTFASVKIGIVGRHKLAFVPLAGATVAPNHLKVTAGKKQVKDAPTIDTDGELTAEQEPAVFAYYQLAYNPGASGERRLGRR